VMYCHLSMKVQTQMYRKKERTLKVRVKAKT